MDELIVKIMLKRKDNSKKEETPGTCENCGETVSVWYDACPYCAEVEEQEDG